MFTNSHLLKDEVSEQAALTGWLYTAILCLFNQCFEYLDQTVLMKISDSLDVEAKSLPKLPGIITAVRDCQ